ncbi:MAG: hypothetical protein MJ252_27760, partial [archaeon]|nr:hypothetical protein [archaeon]
MERIKYHQSKSTSYMHCRNLFRSPSSTTNDTSKSKLITHYKMNSSICSNITKANNKGNKANNNSFKVDKVLRPKSINIPKINTAYANNFKLTPKEDFILNFNNCSNCNNCNNYTKSTKNLHNKVKNKFIPKYKEEKVTPLERKLKEQNGNLNYFMRNYSTINIDTPGNNSGFNKLYTPKANSNFLFNQYNTIMTPYNKLNQFNKGSSNSIHEGNSLGLFERMKRNKNNGNELKDVNKPGEDINKKRYEISKSYTNLSKT